jgi:hypothetical protein
MNRPLCLILLFVLATGGCFRPERASIYSSDPSLKIPAIKTADDDKKAIYQMVKDLDSDDPAVRFFTINKLKEITGNTFGYRYYDDEIRRKPALKLWQDWLAEREGTSRPTNSPAPSS